jgi:hypothetical protein
MECVQHKLVTQRVVSLTCPETVFQQPARPIPPIDLRHSLARKNAARYGGGIRNPRGTKTDPSCAM